MSELKKPQPGEWWGNKAGNRVYFHGITQDGRLVWEDNEGDIDSGKLDWWQWHHLPRCTGWDLEEPTKPDPIAQRIMVAWMRLRGISDDEIATQKPDAIEVEIENLEAAVRMQLESFDGYRSIQGTKVATATVQVKPAEQWPKYYAAVGGQAYVRRDSATHAVYVYSDGAERPFGPWMPEDYSRQELTESEAKSLRQPARLQSSLTPTQSLSTCPDCGEFRGHGHEDVCPMAWVIQDLCDVRPEIDQVYRSQSSKQWLTAAGPNWVGVRHGRNDDGDILHVRCRRQDLPQFVETVAAHDELDEHDFTIGTFAIVDSKNQSAGSDGIVVPFGDAMSQPKNRLPVRLIGRRSGEVRWQEIDESVNVHDVIISHDANGFYIERERSQSPGGGD